jgi:Ca-activated chloride channel family protein
MSLLLALLSVSAQQAPSASDTNLLFTVIDKKSSQFVQTLRKEDIRVLENGVQQEITAFSQRNDVPLSIVLMLDMSLSQEKIIPITKLMAREFVDSITRQSKDSVSVITFFNEAKIEQELTSDLQQVRQAIGRLEFIPPSGYISGGMIVLGPPPSAKDQQFKSGTSIWDAIWFASEKLSAQTPANTRRAIILFSDGYDISSKRKLNDAVEIAIKSGVVVYSMGMGDEYYGGVDKDTLEKISERTGGRAFFPDKVKDLKAALAKIGQELRSQYLISYSPANKNIDDKMRKIKIEVVNPDLRKQGLQLSHPQGYYAKKG